MLITRSSFAGSGKYVSKWLGDNIASFEYMGYSVNGIMHFNAYGMPLVGGDICGFMGETTDDLCEKWHLLGAFYPFSRNHNAMGEKSQEPTTFNDTVRANMKQAV